MTDYAIVVVTTLASDVERLRSSQEIAQQVHLERTTVAKILKILTKKGLILSYRGSSGGYRLAKAPHKITVGEVIEAMEGPIGMTECSVTPGACGQETWCKLQSNWKRISAAVESALHSVTMDQMMDGRPDEIEPLKVRLMNTAS